MIRTFMHRAFTGSKIGALALAAVISALAAVVGGTPAYAHGERNQEPFLRMRTTHYYDVKFSVPSRVVTGKVKSF